MRRDVPFIALLAAVVACSGDASRARRVLASLHATRPDELPALLTGELPFKYPPPLYVRRVQGNVTLKLFIDQDGRVVDDSTHVEEPSGYPMLDTAAIRGAHDLHFAPARLHGSPMAMSILFPVYFRHPEAPPLPGDTILNVGKTG